MALATGEHDVKPQRPSFIRTVPDEVERYGPLPAMVLAHIRYRCESDGPDRFDRDGFRWWPVTRRNLGYEVGVSADAVKRALSKLGDAVVSANNFDDPSDQTRAYRPALDRGSVTCQKAKSPGSDLPEGEIAKDRGEIAEVPGRNRRGTGGKSPSALPIETLETRDKDKEEARDRALGPASADPTPGQLRKRPKQTEPRGTRLPDRWMPDPAVVATMRAEYPHVDLKAEHQKFTDYWIGRAGSGARKADWNATWRNWIRRAAESPSRHTASQSQPARRDGLNRGEAKVAGWAALGSPPADTPKAIGQ